MFINVKRGQVQGYEVTATEIYQAIEQAKASKVFQDIPKGVYKVINNVSCSWLIPGSESNEDRKSVV